MPRVSSPGTAVHRKATLSSGSGRPVRSQRSRCPVSCTLDVVGDRWSLLVVRDLMRGKRRFSEFMESPESIPTNILTERLKRLGRAGIISSRRYCSHPPRVEYVLTARGEDLRPMVRAMADWGVRHAGGRLPPAPPAESDPGRRHPAAAVSPEPLPAPRAVKPAARSRPRQGRS